MIFFQLPKDGPTVVPARLKRMEVVAAREDLNNRSLAKIESEFARLIYLASTRDYSTGRYHHDGLAFQYSEEAAEKALAEAHLEIFESLALGPLENLVQQIQLYLSSVGSEPRESIRAWEKLEPYKVAIPVDCDPLAASLFFANVKIALAIVDSRLEPAR